MVQFGDKLALSSSPICFINKFAHLAAPLGSTYIPVLLRIPTFRQMQKYNVNHSPPQHSRHRHPGYTVQLLSPMSYITPRITVVAVCGSVAEFGGILHICTNAFHDESMYIDGIAKIKVCFQ